MEDPLHGLHSRQFWFLPVGTHENLGYASPVDNKAALHHVIVDVCQTICNYHHPWWEVSKRALHLMEDILSTYYKCTLSTVTHKYNFFGHMLMWNSFSSFVFLNLCPKFVRIFQSHFIQFLHLAPSTGIELPPIQTHVRRSGEDTLVYQNYFHHQSILKGENIAPQSYSLRKVKLHHQWKVSMRYCIVIPTDRRTG
jgi:hypothetical protein